MAVLAASFFSCTAASNPQQEEKEQPVEKPDEKPDDKPDDKNDEQPDDNPVQLEVDVITWSATNVTNTSATLSGSYENVTTELRDHGFFWGTSEDALTEQISLDSNPASAADFEATLSSLEPGTTYYFKAFVTVWDEASGKYVDVGR